MLFKFFWVIILNRIICNYFDFCVIYGSYISYDKVSKFYVIVFFFLVMVDIFN